MKIALTATLAAWIALAALAGVAGGLIGAMTGWLGPYTSFRLFGGGAVLGGLGALTCGLLGLWMTRGGAVGGRPQAWFGVAVGLLLLTILLVKVLPVRSAPPIHDVTTDLDDPPAFRIAGRHPDNAGRDLTYPLGGRSVPDRQRAAYPDLAPVRVALAPAAAFELALETIEALGWTMSWSNAELGLIEATESSNLFRFVDDVAVRVRPDGEGSVVDLRSTSRVGVSDLGANAERIRRFSEELQSRAAARQR
jgi:uncharacterized protein (DUF1499 family)